MEKNKKNKFRNIFFSEIMDEEVYERKPIDNQDDDLVVSVDEVGISSKDHNIKKSKSNYSSKKKEKKEKKSKKKIVTPKKIVIFGAAGVLGVTGIVLFRNRKPSVDITNAAIIESVSSKKSIDEVIDIYNNDLEKANIANLDSNMLNSVLSGETDIVTAIDKTEFYLYVSDRLSEYDLDDIVSFNGDLRSLTEEEKTEIDAISTEQLIKLMDEFEEMEDVDYRDFTKEAIEKCSLGMRLSYAEKIVNNQLIKYGSFFLSRYPELIVQSTLIDETNLDIDTYSNIQIKNIDDDDNYEVFYYEPEIGAYYNVELNDKYLRSITQYKEFFDKYSTDSTKEDFKTFKKTARKAINDYKISILKDYDLSVDDEYNTISYDLDSKDSNYDVRQKVKKLR